MKKSVTSITIVMLIAAFLFNACQSNSSGKTDGKTDGTVDKVNLAVTAACRVRPIVLSPKIPDDVCIPSGFGGNPIDFFDDFSWKIFIAMVWPSIDGQRGQANENAKITGPGKPVFTTYKTLAEIFKTDGSAPGAWNTYDNVNACGSQPAFGQMVLASFSKFSNLGQAGFSGLVGPLPCQNGTYTRFETSFNQIEFDAIVKNQWYLRANITGKTITFPNGAIDIKTSWIDMKDVANPSRYYTQTAIVGDPFTGQCSPKLVGLAGIHIVVKTPSRPQWIWSTFEHIDLIPQNGAMPTHPFNNGTNNPTMPDDNPNTLNPLSESPTMVNVTRVKPIHNSTAKTNVEYRAALNSSVWANYQLVMTQWPLGANSAAQGTPPNTFPGNNPGDDATAFANLTMETFEQKQVRTGCMNCHNFARRADFLWTLSNHASPPIVPNFALKQSKLLKNKAAVEDTALQELKALLKLKNKNDNPKTK